MLNKTWNTRLIIAATIALGITACSSTSKLGEQATHEGLVKVPDSAFQEVYRKPGADIAGYAELGLAPCRVAFRRNWMRDQNSTRVDLSARITQEDVDRIKDRLSEACDEKFREALLEKPAYNLVDNFDDGQHVLVLHPSIINLDINAPDVQSTGINRSYTTSAGEMTLVLELTDATTGETLARAIEKWRGRDNTYLEWTNSVTNRAEANRVLKRWALKLRQGLDEARKTPATHTASGARGNP